MHEEIDTDSARPTGPEDGAITDRCVEIIHQPARCVEGETGGCAEPIGSNQAARRIGTRTKIAYVYVLGAPVGLPVKVGVSGNPKMRLVNVRYRYPHLDRVAFAKAFTRANAYRVESETFRILMGNSLLNEMFNVSVDAAIAAVEKASMACGASEIQSENPLGELKTHVAARIDPDLKAWLEEKASDKKWSLSQYIEVVLTQHIDALHDAQPRPKKRKTT